MASEGSSIPPASQKAPKANWNFENRRIYIELACEEVNKGNRSGSTFTKEGWTTIMNEFNRRTNNSYDMKKFKNHHNKLKEDWKLWDKMMNKYTGFGLDPMTGAVTAEQDVWNDFLQANPEAAIFRTKPLEFSNEMETIFTGLLARGDNMWAPSSGLLPNEVPNVSQTQPEWNLNDDDENVPETQHTNEQNIVGENARASPSLTENALPSRRQSLAPSSSCRPRKRSRASAIDNNLSSMSKYYEWKMLVATEAKKYGIAACISRLNEFPGVQKGSHFWIFAIEMFQSETNRKTFMLIADDVDACVAWIMSKMGGD